MSDFKIFAKRLKELRIEKGLTQQKLSEIVGCTAATISAYENVSKSPSLEVVKTIAEKFCVSLDWLCGMDDRLVEDKSNHIDTYSALFSKLLEIQKRYPWLFEFGKIEKQEKISQEVNIYPALGFDDEYVSLFLGDWKKMYSLLCLGTIDKGLYELWIEKNMQQFNIPIDKQNVISQLRKITYDFEFEADNQLSEDLLDKDWLDIDTMLD